MPVSDELDAPVIIGNQAMARHMVRSISIAGIEHGSGQLLATLNHLGGRK